VAVLGGENDELSCLISRPALSSVDLAPEHIGWQAAALLARLMAGEPPPAQPVLMPTARVVPRQSTDVLAVKDPQLLQAIRYIRDNCARSIKVNELARHVALSRRALEQRFQKVLGRSPGTEIRRARLESAKRLLAETDHSIVRVAEESGFGYPEVLTRSFQRQEHITPTAYRKQVRAP
jgi:LacI family transcriptional regulator